MVNETNAGSSFLTLLPAVAQPQIVLAALTRLRWLAVIGQVAATVVAYFGLHLKLPLMPICMVLVVTAASNVSLHLANYCRRTPAWLVHGVVLLDVLLLTALLFFTGGPENPFAALYLVHVAMAVLVLGAVSTWTVVATVAACYGLLLRWHLPLFGRETMAAWADPLGSWLALVLVSVLIATFVGRVTRALRQREFELAAVRERAVKSEQLAALTTLAAGAAHELNSPLGTIAVVARELELACNRDGDSAMKDDACLIRREVDRCRLILNRMRLDVGEEISFRSVVNLAELSDRLGENFDASQRARLRICRGADADTAVASSRALEQSLLVLLRNAFDASPADRDVHLDIARHDGRIRFEVSDWGDGMSQEMLRRAGEPFFTTKEPGKGMGLGLFLVRLVAEQLGATFSIDSRRGSGTRCVLELPLQEGEVHV